MHYQVEGHKVAGNQCIAQRNYTASQHEAARTWAKHLVEKCGCDSARVLTVQSGETFYPSTVDGSALSSHHGQ